MSKMPHTFIFGFRHAVGLGVIRRGGLIDASNTLLTPLIPLGTDYIVKAVKEVSKNFGQNLHSVHVNMQFAAPRNLDVSFIQGILDLVRIGFHLITIRIFLLRSCTRTMTIQTSIYVRLFAKS